MNRRTLLADGFCSAHHAFSACTGDLETWLETEATGDYSAGMSLEHQPENSKRAKRQSGRTYLLCLAAGAVCTAVFEWRTDEDLVTLAIIAGVSFALGILRPGLFWLSGILIGSMVAALNLFTAFSGLRPIYETADQAAVHDLAYGLSLFVLVAPATLACGFGALVGRAARGGSG